MDFFTESTIQLIISGKSIGCNKYSIALKVDEMALRVKGSDGKPGDLG